jgi:protein pelota
MRVLKENFKEGEFRLIPENDDDLWQLYLMIEKGDKASGKATRKVKVNEKDSAKKVFWVDLLVEKTEFKASVLKVMGTILSELEDAPKGSYQSINLSGGDELKLSKESVSSYFREKLAQSKRPKYLFLLALFDRSEMLFAQASNSGVEIISKSDISSGKRQGSDVDTYKAFVDELRLFSERYSRIIIGCPFVLRGRIEQALPPEIREKSVFASISSVSSSGLREILSADEVSSEISKLKIGEDTKKINQLLSRVAQNDKVAYGLSEVKKACDLGAVEELLVSERLILKSREEGSFEELDSPMKIAEKTKSKVSIISTESSSQLDSLGGIAAFLRFNLV